MAKAYSMDLRIRVMTGIHNGCSERKTAKKFAVSRQWIQQLKQKEKGSVSNLLFEIQEHLLAINK